MNVDTKTSYWIVLFTAFFVAAGVMLNANRELNRLDGFSVTPPPSLPQSSGAQEAKVEIDFNNGTKRMFVAELATIYRLSVALSSVAEAGGFTYRIKNGKLEELAGVTGEWKIYRNGEPVEQSVELLTIKNGDHYVFRAEP